MRQGGGGGTRADAGAPREQKMQGQRGGQGAGPAPDEGPTGRAQPDRIVLRANTGGEEATAEVALNGAELRRWTIGGHDLLWSGDPQVWDGVAPVLFPVVGWTRDGRVRSGGQIYPLGLHGFARHCTFAVSDATDNSVSLTLRDSAETRALYPFSFQLTVSFTLAAHGLDVVLAVANTGGRSMPYAAGWHPGFLRPQPLDGAGRSLPPCDIVFDEEERRSVPVIAPGGLFSTRERTVDFDGRTLPIGEHTFAHEALCFLHARSRGLTLGSPAPGARRLRVAFEELPHIVLWSTPGAPFVCIEGWSGWGDPEGYDGDLADKPGMILLPPGAQRRHAMRMSIVPGHAHGP